MARIELNQLSALVFESKAEHHDRSRLMISGEMSRLKTLILSTFGQICSALSSSPFRLLKVNSGSCCLESASICCLTNYNMASHAVFSPLRSIISYRDNKLGSSSYTYSFRKFRCKSVI